MLHKKKVEEAPAPPTDEPVPAARAESSGDWLDRWFAAPWPGWSSVGGESPAEMVRVEQFTEGNQVVVRAEMPGIDPDKDVQITLSDHTLRLHGERRQESKTEEQGSVRSEFQYGSFTRLVPLPVGATEKDVKATYKDGVLEVRIPVDREAAEAKTIPIQRT